MADRLPKISRRDFLKQMSLIAVGVGLAPLANEVIETAGAAEALVPLPDDVGCVPPSDSDEVVLRLDEAGPLGRLVLDGQEVGLWDLRISQDYEYEAPICGGYRFDHRTLGRVTTQIEFLSSFPFAADPWWVDRLMTVEIYPIQTSYCFSGEAVMRPMSNQSFGWVDGSIWLYNLEVIGKFEGRMV